MLKTDISNIYISKEKVSNLEYIVILYPGPMAKTTTVCKNAFSKVKGVFIFSINYILQKDVS